MPGPCGTCRPGWRIGAISEQPPHDSDREGAPEPGPSRCSRSRPASGGAAASAHGAPENGTAALEEFVRSLAGAPEIQALRKETLDRVRERASRPAPLWRTAAPLAASVLLMLGIGSWFARENLPDPLTMAGTPPAGERIHTALGQRAEVTLADGSKLVLNTDSEVKVAFNEETRRVELLHGQAWFEVAKDQERPFVVAAAGREITALGTAFDVRIDRGRLEVMLLEGRVRVARPAPRDKPASVPEAVMLAPRQMLVVREDGLDVRKLADTTRVEGWRSGLLIFEDQPLAEAVGEFNRYAARPLRIADTETGAIRISGAFRIGDDRAFLGALSAGFGVEAQVSETGITLSRD